MVVAGYLQLPVPPAPVVCKRIPQIIGDGSWRTARKVPAKCRKEPGVGGADARQVLLALSGRTLRWMLSMTCFKYFLAILVGTSCYAAPFLFYPLPTFSYLVFWIALACWIPLFFFSLGALFRRDAKAVAIFLATWVLTILPFFDLEPLVRFREWLLVAAFSIHISPVEDYLSTCKMTHFVEKGIKQAAARENPISSVSCWSRVARPSAARWRCAFARRKGRCRSRPSG